MDLTKDTGATDTAAVGGADGGDPSGSADADGGAEGGARDVEACDWSEIGLCVELANDEGAKGWCASIGTNYGFETVYADGPCGSPGDDFSSDLTPYFYPEHPADAERACGEAGGS